MSTTDEQFILSHASQRGLPSSPETNFSSPDLDDIDDDDDEYADSLEDIQNILQTFGTYDCSPLSLEYYESRCHDIMFEMMNIEKQFENLKNLLYNETILLIDRKLISIQNEEASEYQDELKKLEDEMKLHLEMTKQRRHIELQALENSIESELLSLEQTFENDKLLLYHRIREDIEQNINELEKLKNNTELCETILQELFPSDQREDYSQMPSTNKRRLEIYESTRSNTKKRRFNGSTKTNDKTNLAIIYQISDVNIIEDWGLIQNSLQSSTSSLSNDIDDNCDNENLDDNNDDSNL